MVKIQGNISNMYCSKLTEYYDALREEPMDVEKTKKLAYEVAQQCTTYHHHVKKGRVDVGDLEFISEKEEDIEGILSELDSNDELSRYSPVLVKNELEEKYQNRLERKLLRGHIKRPKASGSVF